MEECPDELTNMKDDREKGKLVHVLSDASLAHAKVNEALRPTGGGKKEVAGQTGEERALLGQKHKLNGDLDDFQNEPTLDQELDQDMDEHSDVEQFFSQKNPTGFKFELRVSQVKTMSSSSHKKPQLKKCAAQNKLQPLSEEALKEIAGEKEARQPQQLLDEISQLEANSDQIGEELLLDKDKQINCSNRKIAVKSQPVDFKQLQNAALNPTPSEQQIIKMGKLATTHSLNQLYTFQKMEEATERHSYQIFDRLKCNLLQVISKRSRQNQTLVEGSPIRNTLPNASLGAPSAPRYISTQTSQRINKSINLHGLLGNIGGNLMFSNNESQSSQQVYHPILQQSLPMFYFSEEEIADALEALIDLGADLQKRNVAHRNLKP